MLTCGASENCRSRLLRQQVLSRRCAKRLKLCQYVAKIEKDSMSAQVQNKQDDASNNSLNPADAAQGRNHAVLKAILFDTAVLCDGSTCKLRAASFQQDGWDIVAAVYLDGSSQVRLAAEIEFSVPQLATVEGTVVVPAEHLQVLLHALHMAHPVTYSGCERFIHTLRFSRSKGDLSVSVWLAKTPEPVPASALRVLERPEPVSGIFTRHTSPVARESQRY
jgi:hypothetical protein